MSDPDVPQRFLDLAKQAGRPALTSAGLRARFGEAGEEEIRVGQVWRARWDEVSILVLVLALESREVLVSPVTIDPPAEDRDCLVVGGSSTAFGVDATVWATLSALLPIRVLDRALDVWSSEVVSWSADMAQGRSTPAPAGTRLGCGGESELDPVASLRAELADEIDTLLRAPGLPEEAAGTPTPSLTSLLGGGVDLQALGSSLGMRQPEVMRLLRGKIPLKPDQIATIARVTGVESAEISRTVRPLPAELVAVAEHPRWRHVWHKQAQRADISETEARLSGAYGAFALAARETGGSAPNWDERLRRHLSDEQTGSGGA
ncbi:hypothetical protein [Amycolatopsis lexingtonensis]|uniref:hypothetical protein n=1 Tax=Amycolatopsis lexingtonensis TaxID=218822 RepID=UPI003F728048